MDRLPDFDDRPLRQQALQQRIGERYAITVPVAWAIPPESRWRPKPKPEPVITEDWSLTGLGFTAPTRTSLHPPCPILITVGPFTGQALLTAMRPLDDPEKSLFGVEFRDQALEEIARDLIAIHLENVPTDRRHRTVKTPPAEPFRPDFGDWH